MAKVYMLSEIEHLGGNPFWAEERNHEEMIECQSGAFVRCNLIFSGCKTVGDFWKWQEQENYLEIRYWNEKPIDEERASTPWTPYEVATYNLINGKERFEAKYITEEEFEQLKMKYPIYEIPIEGTYKYTFREMYKCDNQRMDILRARA